MDRVKWITSNHTQVVLTISQLFWTKQAEEFMETHGADGMVRFEAKNTQQLNDIVEKVRGDLKVLERANIEPLIVLDVHARDVIKDLADNKIADVSDFEWLAQLRYY